MHYVFVVCVLQTILDISSEADLDDCVVGRGAGRL